MFRVPFDSHCASPQTLSGYCMAHVLRWLVLKRPHPFKQLKIEKHKRTTGHLQAMKRHQKTQSLLRFGRQLWGVDEEYLSWILLTLGGPDSCWALTCGGMPLLGARERVVLEVALARKVAAHSPDKFSLGPSLHLLSLVSPSQKSFCVCTVWLTIQCLCEGHFDCFLSRSVEE